MTVAMHWLLQHLFTMASDALCALVASEFPASKHSRHMQVRIVA